jgi:PPP family 3-phenylpropionic acid transporter
MREYIQMQKVGRYPAQYALFLMAYYVTNSVYQSFLPIYFKDNLGFSSTQIGMIFAVVAIVSVATQPFWGARGDRVQSRNALIRFLCAAGAGVMLSILLAQSYLPVLILTCLFAGFYTSIQPMGDSVILESLQKRDHPFGPIRLAGGLSFAVSSTLFGWVLNKSQKPVLAVWVTAGLLGMVLLSTFALPKTPGHQPADGARVRMTQLFKMKNLMLLLAFSMPIQVTMGYFYSFFSNHFLQLEGGNSALLGWCYFISAGSEVPYLLVSDRLFKKIGAGKLLCISALTLSGRWIALALSSDYRIVMFSQILHGWGFIVMTVAVSKYISLTVPPELKASGQMLLAIVSFGISRAIGNLGGGLLADQIGLQNVYYISTAVCLASFAAFAPYFLRRPALNGQEAV